MVTFALSDLQTLAQVSGENCVSLYLPTHRGGGETRQDPIRLKNLTQQAIATLEAQGQDPDSAQSYLQPAIALIEQYDYWQHQDRGLALFIGPNFFSSYQLPYGVEELCRVQPRFQTLPLLPLLMENKTFYILAASQNRVRLFQATRYKIQPVPLEGLPSSLAEALKYDDPEKTSQQHTAGSDSIFHGQGASNASENSDILRFFQKVNRGLHERLVGCTFPLVFAGVESLFPIYQEANSYPHLLGQAVVGNPDVADAEALHCHAWEAVAPLLEQERQDAIAQFALSQSADKASAELDYLVPAALRGQIDTLLVETGTHVWGKYEAVSPTQTRIEMHEQPQPGDQDLLNLAAAATAVNGGRVYQVSPEHMPRGAKVAGILRYPRVEAMAAEKVAA